MPASVGNASKTEGVRMSYTTYTEVQGDFKNTTFQTTGNVTQTDVTQFIVEADALINSYVSAKYPTPVSAAGDGLNLLKLLSRTIVTLRIKSILEVKQATAVAANQNAVSTLMSMAQIMKMLESIKAGQLKLVGVTPTVSGGGFYSSNYVNNVQPKITKDGKDW